MYDGRPRIAPAEGASPSVAAASHRRSLGRCIRAAGRSATKAKQAGIFARRTGCSLQEDIVRIYGWLMFPIVAFRGRGLGRGWPTSASAIIWTSSCPTPTRARTAARTVRRVPRGCPEDDAPCPGYGAPTADTGCIRVTCSAPLSTTIAVAPYWQWRRVFGKPGRSPG